MREKILIRNLLFSETVPSGFIRIYVITDSLSRKYRT